MCIIASGERAGMVIATQVMSRCRLLTVTMSLTAGRALVNTYLHCSRAEPNNRILDLFCPMSTQYIVKIYIYLLLTIEYLDLTFKPRDSELTVDFKRTC